MFGTSPPGSITAAFFVASHQISVQFCSNGVAGMMAARAFGCTEDWVSFDILPHRAISPGGEGETGLASGKAGLKKAGEVHGAERRNNSGFGRRAPSPRMRQGYRICLWVMRRSGQMLP